MKKLLRWIEYIELKNVLPSHDAIRRVMGMFSPKALQ